MVHQSRKEPVSSKIIVRLGYRWLILSFYFRQLEKNIGIALLLEQQKVSTQRKVDRWPINIREHSIYQLWMTHWELDFENNNLARNTQSLLPVFNW